MRHRKTGFRRQSAAWETVLQWSEQRDEQADFDGEIAGIMFKSMDNPQGTVTPKYGFAISGFR
jgi:hypothetical protein